MTENFPAHKQSQMMVCAVDVCVYPNGQIGWNLDCVIEKW